MRAVCNIACLQFNKSTEEVIFQVTGQRSDFYKHPPQALKNTRRRRFKTPLQGLKNVCRRPLKHLLQGAFKRATGVFFNDLGADARFILGV